MKTGIAAKKETPTMPATQNPPSHKFASKRIEEEVKRRQKKDAKKKAAKAEAMPEFRIGAGNGGGVMIANDVNGYECWSLTATCRRIGSVFGAIVGGTVLGNSVSICGPTIGAILGCAVGVAVAIWDYAIDCRIAAASTTTKR